jgi:RNA polymerase sigma factor (sigma-70 family)
MKQLSGTRVVVVGAGFGGLAAAAYLRRAGAEVTVVERAHHVGGKAAKLERDGFVFDAGPTLLTMPDVMRDVFRAVGADLDHVAPLERLAPIARYVFASGKELVVHADSARTKASIAAISQRDAARWDAFLAACKDVWEVAGEPFLEAPFDGLLGFTQRALAQGPRAMKLGMSLGTLDARSREVVRLKFEEDLSYAEIGQRTGISAGNVGYLLHHALKAIGLELARTGLVP